MKVVLAGPPRSGKSCLREGLKQAIRALPEAPYPYVITACPDGEGSWFQETATGNLALAQQLKTSYKAGFTPSFVQRVSESVASSSLPFVLIDIGGVVSQENEQICAAATHAILLADDPARLPEWVLFCQKLGIQIIAEIISVYQSHEDEVPSLGNDGIWRGTVHHLERGELVAQRPTIQALARLLVTLEI